MDDLVAEFERAERDAADERAVCSCGAEILRVDYDLVCSDCGSVQEGRYNPNEDLPEEAPKQSHFRIAGSNAYIYQSNLYKSSESNYSETQKIHNERTYRARLNDYIKKGLRPPFPINVCRKGMELYHQVRSPTVKLLLRHFLAVFLISVFAASSCWRSASISSMHGLSTPLP
jgi:hypothetical protein